MAKVLELLSKGMNRKLGKQVAILNLPAGDPNICIGMTEICMGICYAEKAQRIYTTARDKRSKNYLTVLELLKTPGALTTKLIEEVKAAKVKHVRWHESGDFFNQQYLDEIYNVCRALPEVSFLAYTKSFTLNFSGKPDNLSLYMSLDKSSSEAPAGYPTARIVLKDETPPEKTATCGHNEPKHYCGQECFTCWNGKANVYFDQH